MVLEYQLDVLVTVGLDHMTPKEPTHCRSVVEGIDVWPRRGPLRDVGIDAPSQPQEVLESITVGDRSYSDVGRHPEGSPFLGCSTEPVDEGWNLILVEPTFVDDLNHQLHVKGLMEVIEAPGMILASSVLLNQPNQGGERIIESRSRHGLVLHPFGTGVKH